MQIHKNLVLKKSFDQLMRDTLATQDAVFEAEKNPKPSKQKSS